MGTRPPVSAMPPRIAGSSRPSRCRCWASHRRPRWFSLGWRNGRTHPRHGRHARGRPRSAGGEGDRRRAVSGARDGVPRGPRPARRGGGAHRPRRQPAATRADDQARVGPRPLRRLGDTGRRRGLDLRGARVVRPDRDVAAQRGAQDPGRRRRGADVRGGPAPLREGARRGRPGQRRGQAAPGRHRRGRRPRSAAGRPAGGAAGPGARGRDGGAPDPRAGDDRGPLPGVRRPPAGAVRQLVRVLPALGGRHPRRRRHGGERHLPDRRQAARRGGRDGLRRHLPATDPPDRGGQPQGPQQHADPRARRPRLTLGDRLEGRRSRRRPPRPRHHRGLRRLRRAGPRPRVSRSPSTWRCSARPTTPGSRATRSSSRPGSTGPSPTPRTRPRSTRTSIR